MARAMHFSYHKCLTVYYHRVIRRTMIALVRSPRSYRHFNSRKDLFVEQAPGLAVASLNNHPMTLDELGDARVSRFVRDPRDLLISGYHYHRRGAEAWCHVVDPTDEDFAVVNGVVPSQLEPGESMATMMQRLDYDEGLRAELEFRARHLESMRSWPDAESILVQRYEDVLGHEDQAFASIARHYGWGRPVVAAASRFARRLSIAGAPKKSHVRDPRPRQWENDLPSEIRRAIESDWGDVLDRHGYR